MFFLQVTSRHPVFVPSGSKSGGRIFLHSTVAQQLGSGSVDVDGRATVGAAHPDILREHVRIHAHVFSRFQVNQHTPSLAGWSSTCSASSLLNPTATMSVIVRCHSSSSKRRPPAVPCCVPLPRPFFPLDNGLCHIQGCAGHAQDKQPYQSGGDRQVLAEITAVSAMNQMGRLIRNSATLITMSNLTREFTMIH